MKKQCLECQSPVIGRTDKKFCCLDCKSTHHNRKVRLESKWIRSTNKCLMKNRRILRTLLEMGITRVSRNMLESKEFSFSHITSKSLSREGEALHVYEYGYRQSAETEYEIFTSIDEVNSLNQFKSIAPKLGSTKLYEINGKLSI